MRSGRLIACDRPFLVSLLPGERLARLVSDSLFKCSDTMPRLVHLRHHGIILRHQLVSLDEPRANRIKCLFPLLELLIEGSDACL